MANLTSQGLARAREHTLRQLTDRCRVVRDPEGLSDDTFDPVTMKYTPPPDDTTTIYAGPCLLVRRRRVQRRTVEGAADVIYPEWWLMLGINAALGDVAVVGNPADVAVGDFAFVDSQPSTPFEVNEHESWSLSPLERVVVDRRRFTRVGRS